MDTNHDGLGAVARQLLQAAASQSVSSHTPVRRSDWWACQRGPVAGGPAGRPSSVNDARRGRLQSTAANWRVAAMSTSHRRPMNCRSSSAGCHCCDVVTVWNMYGKRTWSTSADLADSYTHVFELVRRRRSRDLIVGFARVIRLDVTSQSRPRQAGSRRHGRFIQTSVASLSQRAEGEGCRVEFLARSETSWGRHLSGWTISNKCRILNEVHRMLGRGRQLELVQFIADWNVELRATAEGTVLMSNGFYWRYHSMSDSRRHATVCETNTMRRVHELIRLAPELWPLTRYIP